MIRDMEREGLLEEYEEAVQRQAALLKRQQAMIDSLQEELGAQQEQAVVSGRKQQARVEALLQQVRTAALEEAGDEIRLLRQERDTALKEKELSEAEGRRQAMEVQRLQQGSFTTTTTTSGVATSTQPASQLEEDYQRVIQALEEETGRLRAEAEQAEEEKVAIVKVNFQLKKEVTSLKLQLEEVRQKTEAVRQGAEESEREAREARGAMTELAAKQAQQEEDMRLLMAHVESLKKNKEHLEGVLHGASGRLHESRTRVAQSVRTAEDALREKDAALLREKHVNEEVRRLEATVGSVGEEAGRQAHEEMVKLRHQHNTSIKTLTQEVSRLEMALNQKQLECERAMSAVKRAEAEVERLETETGRAREEWRKEASVALLRIATLETRVHHLQAEVERWRQEAERSISEADGQRGNMSTRVEELEGRLAAAVEECAAARLEARRATKSATSHASHQAQAEREAASRLDDLKKQLRAKTEETEDISASARVRLEAADATHKEALKQVYQNMAALQDNYSRFQEQVNEERCEWEKRIAELGRRLEGCRKEGQRTMQGRREAETRLAVAREEAVQCKARIEEVEERLRAAERRFTSAKLDTIIKDTVSNNNRETGANNANFVNS